MDITTEHTDNTIKWYVSRQVEFKPSTHAIPRENKHHKNDADEAKAPRLAGSAANVNAVVELIRFSFEIILIHGGRHFMTFSTFGNRPQTEGQRDLSAGHPMVMLTDYWLSQNDGAPLRVRVDFAMGHSLLAQGDYRLFIDFPDILTLDMPDEGYQTYTPFVTIMNHVKTNQHGPAPNMVQTCGVGRKGCLLISLPKHDMRDLAGYTPKCGGYWMQRGTFTPSTELQQLVNLVLLQDSVMMRLQFPEYRLRKYSLFSTAYSTWKAGCSGRAGADTLKVLSSKRLFISWEDKLLLMGHLRQQQSYQSTLKHLQKRIWYLLAAQPEQSIIYNDGAVGKSLRRASSEDFCFRS
ncbi:hypothetical protein GN958_ATG18492 [Phytophthora infestans]|uniref:Uncharacterized protein n=1 Tax=Phytophthora infestans TaxID=4787 RepID=A0A8S9TU54_PHYIN|nr:hypothetical protein GN958_ATG18492 [Phytophthora infestans]